MSSTSWSCSRGATGVHACGQGGGWEGLPLSFSKIFSSEFLSNLNRTNCNVPVFTARQTKAAFEPSDVVMPPTPPRPGSELGWPSSIAALLPVLAPGGGEPGTLSSQWAPSLPLSSHISLWSRGYRLRYN